MPMFYLFSFSIIFVSLSFSVITCSSPLLFLFYSSYQKHPYTFADITHDSTQLLKKIGCQSNSRIGISNHLICMGFFCGGA